MHSKYWALTIIGLFAMRASGQAMSRADSQQFAVGLTRIVLSTASLPGNRPLGKFVVDTLVPGWNALVAAIIREERPGTLLNQDDSTAAYALRLDLSAGPPRDSALVVSVVWSLCSAQYQRESGRLLKYDGTRTGGAWTFKQEPTELLGTGTCSYGLRRRAR
jgi:hypothetical protein